MVHHPLRPRSEKLDGHRVFPQRIHRMGTDGQAALRPITDGSAAQRNESHREAADRAQQPHHQPPEGNQSHRAAADCKNPQ